MHPWREPKEKQENRKQDKQKKQKTKTKAKAKLQLRGAGRNAGGEIRAALPAEASDRGLDSAIRGPCLRRSTTIGQPPHPRNATTP